MGFQIIPQASRDIIHSFIILTKYLEVAREFLKMTNECFYSGNEIKVISCHITAGAKYLLISGIRPACEVWYVVWLDTTCYVGKYQVTLSHHFPPSVFSTLIGRAPTMLRSHWSRASECWNIFMNYIRPPTTHPTWPSDYQK